MGNTISVSKNSNSITGVHFKTDTGGPLGITGSYCGSNGSETKNNVSSVMGGTGRFEINADHDNRANCGILLPFDPDQTFESIITHIGPRGTSAVRAS